MFISPINNTNFSGGKINLKDINLNNLRTYELIKKIADEKNMDIFISKNNISKFTPYENTYTIIATKNTQKISGEFDKKNRGVAFATMRKIAGIEEASARIYNAVMNAIEDLEKNLV